MAVVGSRFAVLGCRFAVGCLWGECLAAALLHALPPGFGGGVVVAVVAHGAEFGGLHMTQMSFDELDAAEGEDAGARVVAVAAVEVAEGDVGVGDGQDA